MFVAFDCDGTLINYDGTPRTEVINLLKAFQALNANIIVWSGGGVDYAKGIVRRLELKNVLVRAKGSCKPDLVIDDQATNMGIVDFQVDPLEPKS